MNTKGSTGPRDSKGRFTSKAEFKIGDKVKIISVIDCEGRFWDYAKKGTIGKITNILPFHRKPTHYFLDSNKYQTNFTSNMLQLVKDEPKKGIKDCEHEYRYLEKSMDGHFTYSLKFYCVKCLKIEHK